jgi:hypothetical protein
MSSSFCLEEFEKPEIKTKLTCVIMNGLWDKPLSTYGSLSGLEKKKFNKYLNEYIKENLNGDDWYVKLSNEFNEIMCLHMGDVKKFQPDKFNISGSNNDIFILKDEHKDFFAQEAEKGCAYSIGVMERSVKGDDYLKE